MVTTTQYDKQYKEDTRIVVYTKYKSTLAKTLKGGQSLSSLVEDIIEQHLRAK